MASLNTRQEDLVRNNPDLADIYWAIEELKSKYKDEVYRLKETNKVLNQENDNLRQEIKKSQCLIYKHWNLINWSSEANQTK